jgi:hypothetical protein
MTIRVEPELADAETISDQGAEPNTGEPRAEQAILLAHEVVLRVLVSKERTKDATFVALARRAFDEFLGRIASEPRDELLVAARRNFTAMLNTRDDLFRDDALVEAPITWRRRFLLWLMRG